MAIEYRQHRWSTDDYEAMVTAGILGKYDKVELIEGEIVEKMPIGPPHSHSVDGLMDEFVAKFAGRAVVRVQGPLRLSDLSEPEPDLQLLLPGRQRYRLRHPRSEDVLLLVEVSDSSLRFHREVKIPLYARAGIVEVWILDLAGRAVDRYRHPGPDGYAERERFEPGSSLAVAAFPETAFAVNEILGL